MMDPAILSALSLDASQCSMQPCGFSGYTSTYKIDTESESLFIKLSKSQFAGAMFEGESHSLNQINQLVPTLCPRALAWGPLSESRGFFLATQFLHFSKKSDRAYDIDLAKKLGLLHKTPAPTPNGFPQFGFPVPTFCGDTRQPNEFQTDWAEFFGRQRLLAVLEIGQKQQTPDHELTTLVNQAISRLVPRLLGTGHLGGSKGIIPVVIHGDLWAGNWGVGKFKESSNALEAVVFDPGSCFAHSEYELGIMQMFGGFYRDFWNQYHQEVPMSDPIEEYNDRVALYECYHHLNHWAIFGGGYKSSAKQIMNRLLTKYKLLKS
eukprot:Protomagalhaensia_wolfi_Nauph_80__1990@NODE_2259_length_1147_cov_3_294224_g1764_i0_p1_GENE_NODE_2259_length_1147_cov_3_294224_g1764_i0NODE_2259_length_1147_cov_3_294224_g1764_i0_p1_ORF_typecomplete_len321_score63_15Fructosamin_kin/PF03881_14/6_7e79APH/PF01636_23/2_6e05_NODE_2259_length_1147_cov_3_294224_g1764_i04966